MNDQEKIIALSVLEIIAEKLCLDLGEVTGDKKLEADIGADSLDAVDIALALDEKFGMELPDELFELDKTVQEIVNYIIKAKADHDTPSAQ